jgi:hypothetical protein
MRNALTQCVLKAAATAVLATAALSTALAADINGKAPRLPDGKPNFNGVWQALNTANYNIEPHSASAALALVPGQFVPVPNPKVVALGAVGAVPGGLGIVEGGEIPYKPEALVQRNKNRENYLDLDPEIRCYMPGVPRANYMPHAFQIVQSKDYIFFAYEFAGAVRNIYMKDPGPAPTDSWMGQSVGKWEGDTLVVTVTGQNDQTWFDRAGNWHTEAMTVVERYTARGPDHIMYEATITDPNVFTKPWKIKFPLYRKVEENAQLGQFKCVEFVEELMYGHLRKVPTQPAPKVDVHK